MKTYLESKYSLAEYVDDRLRCFAFDCPLTMTMQREPSGGYSVQIVTEELSDDTEQEQVAKFFSETQVNT